MAYNTVIGAVMRFGGTPGSNITLYISTTSKSCNWIPSIDCPCLLPPAMAVKCWTTGGYQQLKSNSSELGIGH